MKPRVKASRETDEDWDIWLWVNRLWARHWPSPMPWNKRSRFAFIYAESDRRDADLMWEWQRAPHTTAEVNQVGYVDYRGIRQRGFLEVSG